MKKLKHSEKNNLISLGFAIVGTIACNIYIIKPLVGTNFWTYFLGFVFLWVSLFNIMNKQDFYSKKIDE